jgi:hypothetical protein
MKTVHRVPMKLARATIGQLAKRAHSNNEIFILESDGIPLAGLMNVSDLEDYLDTQDPKVKMSIAKSHQDFLAGRVRPAREMVAELKAPAKRAGTKKTKMRPR